MVPTGDLSRCIFAGPLRAYWDWQDQWVCRAKHNYLLRTPRQSHDAVCRAFQWRVGPHCEAWVKKTIKDWLKNYAKKRQFFKSRNSKRIRTSAPCLWSAMLQRQAARQIHNAGCWQAGPSSPAAVYAEIKNLGLKLDSWQQYLKHSIEAAIAKCLLMKLTTSLGEVQKERGERSSGMYFLSCQYFSIHFIQLLS